MDQLRQGDKMETIRLIEKSLIPRRPTKIAIQSSVSVLPADGESTTKIKLEIFDQDDDGLANQQINIEPDLGRLSLIEDHQNGIYTAVYTAGIQVGQENLIAETNNGQMDTVQIELIEPLTPATITVIASELSLPADGKATSQLQVSVLNQRGNGLTEQKITLDATLGQISSLQDQCLAFSIFIENIGEISPHYYI